jgi:hypothetical protein
VPWVALEEFEVLVGELSDFIRELPIMEPEIRVGEMI